MAEIHPPADALGLYLSIPFCRSKCTFCNFASGVYPASELPRYVSRLIEDIAGARRRAEAEWLSLPEQVDTIYFGGGTPSILSPDQLRSIFASLHEHFRIDPDAEITLEAAPAMLADEVLAAAVECGVNRISFGVQTFVNAEARAVGRLHTAAQALDDLARARRAGIKALSVDLICGLPGQTETSWRQSLATLGKAAPEHVSIYMLEVDEDSRLGGEMLLGGTRYGAGLTPSDDAVADFYTEACSVLGAQGLAQYEISNFARPGFRSRHNERYWQRRPYLGVGLDAHSMLRSLTGAREGANGQAGPQESSSLQPVGSTPRRSSGPTERAVTKAVLPSQAVRFGTADELAGYLNAATPWATLHRLTRAEEVEEAWFLGLRRTAGVSLAELAAEFGASAIKAHEPLLGSLAEDGLITRKAGRVALTHRGSMLSNVVFASFLDRAEADRERCAEPVECPGMAAAAQ